MKPNLLEQLVALYGGNVAHSSLKRIHGRSKSHRNGRRDKCAARRERNREMKRENKRRKAQRRAQRRRGR